MVGRVLKPILKYCIFLTPTLFFKVHHNLLQSTQNLLQRTVPSKGALYYVFETIYSLHSNVFLQSTTQPSSKYHITIFKVPYLQHVHSIMFWKPYIVLTPTLFFKVPHNLLQSTTEPSSKYHTFNTCTLLCSGNHI